MSVTAFGPLLARSPNPHFAGKISARRANQQRRPSIISVKIAAQTSKSKYAYNISIRDFLSCR